MNLRKKVWVRCKGMWKNAPEISQTISKSIMEGKAYKEARSQYSDEEWGLS